MKQTNTHSWLSKVRHQFLLTFFDTANCYQVKEINGFFLIKQFNKLNMVWEVAIYTKESFQRKNAHKNKVKELLTPRRNKQKRG